MLSINFRQTTEIGYFAYIGGGEVWRLLLQILPQVCAKAPLLLHQNTKFLPHSWVGGAHCSNPNTFHRQSVIVYRISYNVYRISYIVYRISCTVYRFIVCLPPWLVLTAQILILFTDSQ
jgi:hypothetical protein